MEKISLRSATGPILAVLALCGALVGIGGWLTQSGIRDLWTSLESAGWPTTRGLVLQATLIEERGVLWTTSRPAVQYRYQVGDRAYASTRVAFEAAASQTSQAVIHRYPAGSEVTIYYKKGAPGISVLEPGGSILSMGLGFYVFFALALLGVGGFGWLVPRIAWRD